MSQLSDNPGQGNRGGQEYGEDTFHKSSGNQDSRQHKAHAENEKMKQDKDDEDEFSPGEPDNYESEDFATD